MAAAKLASPTNALDRTRLLLTCPGPMAGAKDAIAAGIAMPLCEKGVHQHKQFRADGLDGQESIGRCA